MSSADSEWFDDLPPLLARDIARLPVGSNLDLALLNLKYVETGRDHKDMPTVFGVMFRVKYTHKELIYRTPGKKDAVAFGIASMEGDDRPSEVRILFSQANNTATMKGLPLEGKVKPIGRNKALELLSGGPFA